MVPDDHGAGAKARRLKATRRSLVARLGALPVLHSAHAQRGFPDRPIRLIVPFGPGTATAAASCSNCRARA